MPASRFPPTDSFRTLKVRFTTTDEAASKLVLSQLDIVLDKPTTSPKNVYPTSPLRVHRVSDMMKADLDLVYDAKLKTLTVCPCGPYLGALLYMPRLPISFDNRALHQRYNGGASTLPPLAEFIYNAARACALIKHRNEPLGPRDMRHTFVLRMRPIVYGAGTDPGETPHSVWHELVTVEDLPKLARTQGRSVEQDVNTEDGYGLFLINMRYNPETARRVHVTVVRTDCVDLKPKLLLRTHVSDANVLFKRDAQGDVHCILRFARHDELPFNVELIHVVLSTERIESIDDLLDDEKAWDAIYIKATCRESRTVTVARQGGKLIEGVDITDVYGLIQRANTIRAVT